MVNTNNDHKVKEFYDENDIKRVTLNVILGFMIRMIKGEYTKKGIM